MTYTSATARRIDAVQACNSSCFGWPGAAAGSIVAVVRLGSGDERIVVLPVEAFGYGNARRSWCDGR
jgi:HD-like signal output (HDOD) protein